MRLTAIFEPAEEGGFVCWIEKMPGFTQGKTMEEARANLLDALKLSLEYLRHRSQKEVSKRSIREAFEVESL